MFEMPSPYAPVPLEALGPEAGIPAMQLAAEVGRIEMPVEHRCRPATGARPRAQHVRPPVLDLLPLHLQAERAKLLGQDARARLLGAVSDGVETSFSDRSTSRRLSIATVVMLVFRAPA